VKQAPAQHDLDIVSHASSAASAKLCHCFGEKNPSDSP